MRIIYFLLFVILFFGSCAPKKTNQYIKKNKIQTRVGKWVEKDSTAQGEFISAGRYKNGEKVGVWKTQLNARKLQKDVYTKKYIRTRIYHANGKLNAKGQSTTEVSSDFIHWYYTGDWKYFDENRKLIYIKKYSRGKPSDSISYQK